MKSVEELFNAFGTNISSYYATDMARQGMKAFSIEDIQQIHQDAIQSSDLYKKSYLDACEKCVEIAGDLTAYNNFNGHIKIGRISASHDLVEHKESKRKEFGL